MASELNPLRRGSENERRYAYLFITLFLALPFIAGIAALWLGLVSPDTLVPDDLSFMQTVAKGFAYLYVGTFGIWLFIQLSRVAGIQFLRGLLSAIQRLLDGYEAPQNRSQQREADESDDVTTTIDDFDQRD